MNVLYAFCVDERNVWLVSFIDGFLCDVITEMRAQLGGRKHGIYKRWLENV